MTKNYRKIISLLIYFSIFLFIGNLFFINTAYAIDLEVEYPTVLGQDIDNSIELPDFVVYLFNLGMFIGFFSVFISLVIAGVMYFLSPINVEMKTSAKDRVSGAISGLLILVLTYLIINTVNPQLLNTNLDKLPPSPDIPVTKRDPGVYLYKSICSDKTVKPQISNISDLGDLKNRINNAEIHQDPGNGNSYISILYANPDLWGKCLYLNPNKPCQSVDDAEGNPFAESVSIYKYDPTPNGDGVYFFRKSCFDNQYNNSIKTLIDDCIKNSGGYYKVDNKSISPKSGKLYVLDLNKEHFSGVPIEEQACSEYDKNGDCNARGPQTLGGENISSMIINGNYVVLFIYSGPKDTAAGPWTYCQEFPVSDDASRFGPRQIKWQNIRNNDNVIPNYAIIMPIQGVATPTSF